MADGKILVFGDSLSAGYGLHKGEGWVDLLEQKIVQQNLKFQVVNASISGDTTDNGLRRLPQTLENVAPNIVVLELGGNDGLRGLNLKDTKNNLAKMIELSLAINAKVLLVGMQLPPNYGAFYVNQFNNVYSDLAEEKNIPLLPFLLAGFESEMEYFQKDKIHPNAKAQTLIMNNVWKALKPLL